KKPRKRVARVVKQSMLSANELLSIAVDAIEYLPVECIACPQGSHGVVAQHNRVWHLPGFFDQGDGVYVAGQAVEVGAVATGKTLQFVEDVIAIKKFGVKFKGGVVGITAGAAAGGILVGAGVGGGVCDQVKLGIAAGSGMNQRL